MDNRNDNQLLAEYVASGSDAAFTALVERHSGLVHGCAMRRTRDPHLADEVSQTVFLLLAQKGADIRPGTLLAGWLFRATCFVTKDVLKQVARRTRLQVPHNEATMNPSAPETPSHTANDLWQSIEGHLDELLQKLAPADRDALLLRHMEGESLASLARTLGTTEEGARKRVARALEKVRHMLHRRGITTSHALLSLCLDQHAVTSSIPAAPSNLAAMVLEAKAAGVVAHVPGMGIGAGLFGLGKTIAAVTAVSLGLGIVALTGVLLPPLFTQDPFDRPIQLPDQSLIEFQKPAFGENHLITLSTSTWKHLQERWPNRKTEGRRNATPPFLRMQLNSMNETLVFPAIRVVPTGVSPWSLWLLVVDNEGREYFDAEQSGMMNEDTQLRLEAHVLTAFPRRERTLQFRLSARPPGGGESVEVSRFQMENPVFRSYPEWKPEPLPSSRTNQDLVVVLHRLRGARNLASQRVDARNGMHRDAAAYVRFMDPMALSNRWFPTDVDIADATGNRYSTGFQAVNSEGNETVIPLRGALWPGEKAWELTFHLARHSGFLESEKLRSDPIDIPRPGHRVELDSDLESPDGSVSLESISSTDVPDREPWKWPKANGDLVLHLEWKPTDRERWLELLEIIDDQGRPVPFRVPQRGWLAQSVGIDLPPGARQLRFVFATQKTLEVKFRAAAEPEAAVPSKTSTK